MKVGCQTEVTFTVFPYPSGNKSQNPLLSQCLSGSIKHRRTHAWLFCKVSFQRDYNLTPPTCTSRPTFFFGSAFPLVPAPTYLESSLQRPHTLQHTHRCTHRQTSAPAHTISPHTFSLVSSSPPRCGALQNLPSAGIRPEWLTNEKQSFCLLHKLLKCRRNN